jgi:hypothetical protein
MALFGRWQERLRRLGANSFKPMVGGSRDARMDTHTKPSIAAGRSLKVSSYLVGGHFTGVLLWPARLMDYGTISIGHILL